MWSKICFINNKNKSYILEVSDSVPKISDKNKIIDNTDNIFNNPNMSDKNKDIDIIDKSPVFLD